MSEMNAAGARQKKTLRLWPGVVLVPMLFLARFGIKAMVPGFDGFSRGMMTSLGLAAGILLWWLFLSRAPWLERLGAVALMAGSLAATWALKHDSMGPLWLVGYAVPVLCLAFVAWAVAGRHLAGRARLATLAATLMLATGGWALARTEGIDGDHDATFAWRWSKTVEEQLVAGGSSTPESPSPVPTRASTADWPGFRGPNRDGQVSGPRIETDWATSPPVELWRRPVGPGWSSFALHGGLLYTQEQRGEHEMVTCYRASTGEPLWQHRDPARFYESNGGAGPRATPVVHDGVVYTLGATGLVNALRATDGTALWSRDLVADTEIEIPTWGFSGSPAVAGDLIVPAAGQLVAYDLLSGELRWTTDDGGISYSSPHPVEIDGIAQVLLMSGAGTSSYSPADGSLLWQHPWGGFPMIQPARLPGGDLLVSATQSSGVRRLAVSLENGDWRAEERWTSLGLKPYFNDFVVHEGHAYGFDGRILACLELESGERRWKGGRYGSGQLVLLPAQDLLLVLSEQGEVVLVEAGPEQFRELARLPAIEGKTWNHPVIAGDLLLVRNAEQMVAFRLPVES